MCIVINMPTKNVYIAEADLPLFEQAARLAGGNSAAVVAGRGPMTSAPASPVMTPRSLRGDDSGAIAAEPLRLRVRHSRVAPAEAGGAESVARRLIESWFSCEPGLDA